MRSAKGSLGETTGVQGFKVCQLLEKQRMKLAGHILRADDSDPLRQISYQPSTAKPVEIGVRRVPGPRKYVNYGYY